MLDLDIRTLLVVTALAAISSAIALISLWLSQSRRNGAGCWAVGMSLVALASILISGRDSFSDFISLVLANSFFVLGFVLILRGIRIFAKRPPLLFFDYVLPPIAAMLFYYFNYVEQNINLRIAVISFAFMSTCLAIVVTLLSQKTAPWRVAGFSVATIFGLFGLFHGLRGVIALVSPFENFLMQPSMSTSLVFLAGIFILVSTPVTLLLLTYASLESELRIASLAVNQSASSIIITDTNGAIEYVNPAFTDNTGYSLDEVIGINPRILHSGETPTEQYDILWNTLSRGHTWRGEFHNRKKNGELFWEIASVAPVKQKNGNISHYVAIKEDITALKNAEERIRHLANHDVLTGLPTRRLSMDRFLSYVAIAKRNKMKVAVLFIDIDGFKEVNDSLGHDVGDIVLKEIATRLSSCVREIDTVARVGGDEFLVLLTNVVVQNSVITVAEKLVNTIAMPYQVNKHNINIGASIGIAIYPDHGVTPENLVNRADQAMYKIKRQGKNNYAFA